MNKTYMTIALMSPLVCTAAMGAKKAKGCRCGRAP